MYQCKKCDFSTESRGKIMSHYKQQHRNGAHVPASNGGGQAGRYERAEQALMARAHKALDEMDTPTMNKAVAAIQALREHGTAIDALLVEPIASEASMQRVAMV